MTKKYKIARLTAQRLHKKGKEKGKKKKDKKKSNRTTGAQLVIYNQYTGSLSLQDEGYVLQDGDIIETDDSYYADFGIAPPASFSVDVCDSAGNPVANDVMVYSSTQADDGNAAGMDDGLQNYPSGNSEPTDPGYVEVDPNYVESYEEYYDENDNPVYVAGDCDTSVGIRG